MTEAFRILTLCNGGNVRSATHARMLRKRGYEALNCGVNSLVSDRTLLMLLDWSQVAYIQKDAAKRLGERSFWLVTAHTALDPWVRFIYRGPAYQDGAFDRNGYLSTQFDVGPDDWKKADNDFLIAKFQRLFETYPAGSPRRP